MGLIFVKVQTAFFVFLSASAGAGVVAAGFGSMGFRIMAGSVPGSVVRPGFTVCLNPGSFQGPLE